MSKIKSIFQTEVNNKLPDSFFQQIVEKENEVSLSKNNLNEKTVEELIMLYKKAIEHYAFISNEKMQFFSSRLCKLYVTVKKFQNKPKGFVSGDLPLDYNTHAYHAALYDSKHKQNMRQVQIFMQIDKAKEKIEKMVNDYNEGIGNALSLVDEEINNQKENIKKKKEAKLTLKKSINQQKLNKKNNMEKINNFVEESIKKFHFLYKNSPVFDSTLKNVQSLFEEYYIHKIQKYYFYQEQIKQFELLLGDDDNKENKESLEFYMNDLIKEREKYLKEIENNLNTLESKIKEICLGYKIEEDKKFEEFKLEFLKNITQVIT